MEKELTFPEGFLWGSAVSSYQVEGGIENCNWSEKFSAGKACDYYNRFEEYFDIAKELNQNVHRLSLEWSRIEPKEGEFNQEAVEHYKKMLSSLKDRDMKVMVTLWHSTTPKWLQDKGGWENLKMPEYFSKYAEYVVKDLNEYVDFWITVNEPMIYTSQAYTIERFPPQKKSLFLTAKVAYNFFATHRKTYKIIKNIFPEAKVGFVENYSYPESIDKNPITRTIVSIWDFIRNEALIRSTINQQDFIGVNYYFHEKITLKKKFPFVFIENSNHDLTDMNWEIYPKGIYKVLMKLKKFKKPIYITENGLADREDRKREKFIRDHLEWTHKAIQKGANIKGYLYWSLLDNFEWVDGYEPKFGLVEINFDTLENKIRPSAFEYAKICKNNKITL